VFVLIGFGQADGDGYFRSVSVVFGLIGGVDVA